MTRLGHSERSRRLLKPSLMECPRNTEDKSIEARPGALGVGVAEVGPETLDCGWNSKLFVLLC